MVNKSHKNFFHSKLLHPPLSTSATHTFLPVTRFNREKTTRDLKTFFYSVSETGKNCQEKCWVIWKAHHKNFQFTNKLSMSQWQSALKPDLWCNVNEFFMGISSKNDDVERKCGESSVKLKTWHTRSVWDVKSVLKCNRKWEARPLSIPYTKHFFGNVQVLDCFWCQRCHLQDPKIFKNVFSVRINIGCFMVLHKTPHDLFGWLTTLWNFYLQIFLFFSPFFHLWS